MIMKSTTHQEISCLALLLSAVRRIFFFCKNCQIKRSVKFVFVVFSHKVAEIGSHSARAKGPTKILSGAYLLFLRQMHFFACNCNFAHLVHCDMRNIYHVIMHFLPTSVLKTRLIEKKMVPQKKGP